MDQVFRGSVVWFSSVKGVDQVFRGGERIRFSGVGERIRFSEGGSGSGSQEEGSGFQEGGGGGEGGRGGREEEEVRFSGCGGGYEKSWKIWKSNMDEELVENNATDEKMAENSATDGKIDLKVGIDLSIFGIDGWNELQPIDQKSLEKFIEETMPQLLGGIPSTDLLLATHYLVKRAENADEDMKKLMSLREGLHVMIQCYERQHSADFYRLHEHPGGVASWREPIMRKFAKESTTHYVR